LLDLFSLLLHRFSRVGPKYLSEQSQIVISNFCNQASVYWFFDNEIHHIALTMVLTLLVASTLILIEQSLGSCQDHFGALVYLW
jgi:hypothetical protein